MTLQEYYDLLVRSATDDTFPALGNGRCRYRGEGKKRCAVGVIMPDEVYKPTFDGVGHILENSLSVDSIFHEPQAWFPEGLSTYDLRQVQIAHDGRAIRQTWDARDFVAALNRLSFFQDLDLTDPDNLPSPSPTKKEKTQHAS